jgi:group I intron endonuclease
MISGVYAIVNKANGHRYVGSSSDIERRWQKHVSLLERGKHHNLHLQHAWNYYGKDNFKFVLLFECAPGSLLDHEQDCINKLLPEYNICVTAGSRLGIPHSEVTKNKLAIANIGKKQSEETKRKRSNALRGYIRSDEFRRKESIAHLGIPGRPHTEEAKQRISASLKGRKLSDEDKHKKSIAAMGNQRTLGMHHTEDAKRKISRAKKLWWAYKREVSRNVT